VLAVCSLMSAALVAVSHPAVAASPAAPVVTEAPTTSAAAAAAKATGRRVEALDLRTETNQTFANPDGTLTLEEHLRPQRVRRADGSWAAADPTLRINADGTIAPNATTATMVFSGGGRSPMARMSSAGKDMTLTWPGSLPAPSISGSVATYAEILPGVDLQIMVDVDRFTHIFVIKTPEAAANPAVRKLTVGTSFRGVSLRKGAAGVLEAVDAHGATVFRGASPLMWDSTDKVLAAQGITADPKHAIVGAQVQADKLVLTPDPAMLATDRARFPVYVDPEWSAASGATSHWNVLRYSEPNTSYYDRAYVSSSSDPTYGMMRAGFNDFDPGTYYKDRSVFQMHIPDEVRYAHISHAEFHLTQSWSGAACTDTGSRWTDLHHMNSAFGSSTTWNTSWNSGSGETGWGATLYSDKSIYRTGYSCGAHGVDFAVGGQVAAEAAVGNSSLWVGLRARSETDKYSWKRYQKDASLNVTYNRAPDAPSVLSSDGKGCTTGANRPWVTTATPILSATHTDPDSIHATLTTRFYWWPLGGTRPADTAATGWVDYTSNRGTPASPQIPAGQPLLDGTTYVWQARTFDTIDWGQWSATCEFNADLTPPNDPGVIAAGSIYTGTGAAGGPGIPDTFTFNPPTAKANEVIGYAYTLDDGMSPASGVQVDTIDPATFAASVSIAPTHDGSTTLRVWSKDRAGRYSAHDSEYTLNVSAGGIAANWNFEGASPTTDVTGHGNALTLSASGATVVDGRSSTTTAPNKALSLSGGGYADLTTSPLKTVASTNTVNVRTDASFTVSAWAKISSAGVADQAVVAINGTNTSAFTLGYGGAEGKWVFRMAESDVAAPVLKSAVANGAATANAWTHLTGTYDAATKTLKLYVGGVLQTSTATLTTGFNASGKLSIGSQQWSGSAHGTSLTGAADDVRFDNTVISASLIQQLAVPLKPAMTVLTASPITSGTPVRVKFDATGDTNVTAFKYSVDSLLLSQTGTATGAAYTATLASLSIGMHTIRAKAQDANGLLSVVASITVSVVNATPAVSGKVTDVAGNPIPGAVVSLSPAGLTTTSAADGSYAFTAFPAGTHTVSAVAGTRCAVAGNTSVAVAAPVTVNLALSSDVKDGFGYSCTDGTGVFTSGSALLPLTGDDAITQVSLPFTLPYYGQSVTSVWVDVNGVIFTSSQARSHPDDMAPMPNRATPNNVVAPFWSDLEIDASSGVYTATTGTAPNRKFVVEWRNVFPHRDSAHRLGFEAVLGENGAVTFAYTGIDSPVEAGTNAVVGIENQYGSAGLTYSGYEPALATGTSVTYAYPASPGAIASTGISGTVTAGGAATAGVVVTLDSFGLRTVTDASGGYHFDGLPDGIYQITAQLCAESASANVTIAGGSVTQNLTLTQGADAFGYTCGVGSAAWVPADDTVLSLQGDDVTTAVTLPFSVPFYGQSYSSVNVDTNGVVYFSTSATSHAGSVALPTSNPTGFIAALWDDLQIDGSGSVHTATVGTAPNRQFVIEWRGARFVDDWATQISAEVLLSETGTITLNYQGLTNSLGKGSNATVGIENPAGTSAIQYLYHQPSLLDGEAVTFTYPDTMPKGLATLSGSVTVGGTTVAAPLTVLLSPGNVRTTTDNLGRFQFTGLLPDTYTATAYHCGKSAATAATAVTTDLIVPTLNVVAATGASGSYNCAESVSAFVPGDTQVTTISGDDAGVSVTTPFPIKLFGASTSTIWVDTNGAIYANQPGNWDPGTTAFPNAAAPNNVISPFWDDTVVDSRAGVYTKTTGSAPNRQFIVEWRGVSFVDDWFNQVTYEVIFSENGQITYNYATLGNARAQGSNAYVGLENATGTVGINYLAKIPLLVSGRATTFTPVP